MTIIPLGKILLKRNLISEAQLARSLQIHEQSGSRLGDVLIGEGVIGYHALYHAVAEHCQLPFVDLLKQPPDRALLSSDDAENYLKYRVIPWRRDSEKITLALCDMSENIAAWIRGKYGPAVDCVITSPFDIARTVEKFFGAAIESSSSLSLWEKFPAMSARVTMPARQKNIFFALCLASAAVIGVWPGAAALAFVALCHVAYAATMLFKCGVFLCGAFSRKTQLLPELGEQALPVYTVLVPMYKEAASLPGMLSAMQQMDYPAAKLDIKLVLEADDEETLQAARALKPHYNFEIIRVPTGYPRTKPKACNYALRFVRGDLLTVFDADDRPEKLQLRKAAQLFHASPPDVACLQARLNYYNADDNWLTRFFSLEYSILFNFVLRGLERLGIPIPLGGTSNHIALSRLRELGEWDPFNVTEDADLGTRLAARGLRTVMLDSRTMEEAPGRVPAWVTQRSRWIKGYMQTWLVHMRDPLALYRTLGFKGFVGFQCFVGLSCFTFLTAPVVWALAIIWLFEPAWLQIAFPRWLAWLTAINLFLNFFTQWLMAVHCALLYRRRRAAMTAMGLLYPFYMILHSLASYRALWQLVVRPHFWDKTAHGLAKRPDSAENRGQSDDFPLTARPDFR